MKITVQSGQGVVETNPFGSQQIGTYGFGAMDRADQQLHRAHNEVTPDQFVFFVSHNIFLTSGGCCIGGYHTATEQPAGWQTYGYTTLVTEAGSFSQDVSAASHEIGEWLDDPFTRQSRGLPGQQHPGRTAIRWRAAPITAASRIRTTDLPITFRISSSSTISVGRIPTQWAS